MIDELLGYIWALSPFFCRTFGALLLLPLDSGFSGVMLKFSLSAGGAAFFAAALPAQSDPSLPGLLLEFVLGALITLPAMLVLSSAGALGELFDVLRGQNMAELFDPAHGKGASYCSMFFEKYFLVLLLSCGLLDRVLGVLLLSFESFSSAAAWNPGRELLFRVLEFIPAVLGEFFWFFLPLLLVLALVDLTFSYLGKLLPQAALQTEIMLTKSVVGFVVLVVLYRQGVLATLLGLAEPSLAAKLIAY